MAYSSSYGNEARQKLDSNCFLDLQDLLASYRQGVFVVGVPKNIEVPKNSVVMKECIDVIVETEVEARSFAEKIAKQINQCVGFTKYIGQPAVKLHSEVLFAKSLAEDYDKICFCYYDWKKSK